MLNLFVFLFVNLYLLVDIVGIVSEVEVVFEEFKVVGFEEFKVVVFVGLIVV